MEIRIINGIPAGHPAELFVRAVVDRMSARLAGELGAEDSALLDLRMETIPEAKALFEEVTEFNRVTEEVANAEPTEEEMEIAKKSLLEILERSERASHRELN